MSSKVAFHIFRNIKDDDEIRAAFSEVFENIEGTLRVVFNDQRCLDCGAIGDPRLLSKFCHMQKVRVHKIKEPERVHPLEIVSYHPEDIPIKAHPGYLLRAPWYRDVWRKRIYNCCSGSETAPGCVLKWKCCGQQHRISKTAYSDVLTPDQLGCKKKYTCCQADVTDTGGVPVIGCETLFPCCGRNRNQEGCLEICKKCERPWGSPAFKCFIKPHNVTDITDDDDNPEGATSTPAVAPSKADTLARIENGLVPKKTFLEKCELPKSVPIMVI